MKTEIGRKVWAIAEGYIPGQSTGTGDMISHEAFCILNGSDQDAHIKVFVFYEEKDPVGPYRLLVPAMRTRHFRFNDLKDPETIPKETNYSSIIASDVPIVVQHTRLDSRQSENALITSIAYYGE